tara:strand:+ start:2774 stop:3160 length:387 start_codon:yes stop_codon:yes gene_type:complete
MKTILFLCVENSCRSQIAEAFAKRYSDLSLEFLSAGSSPSGVVNSRAIELMTEFGYDLSDHFSKSVDEINNEVDILISMGCGDSCPYLAASERLEWDIPDPKNMKDKEFKLVIKSIEKKVKALIKEIT